MKITKFEAFQVQWAPGERPEQRGAFLRVHTDSGHVGLGEASPMLGGLASLTILAHHIAPTLIGADPLDHAVIQDRLMHRLVKLGPEGALTGALSLASLRPSGGSGRLVLGAMAIAGASLTVFAVSRSLPVSMLALALIGFFQVNFYSTTNTLIHPNREGQSIAAGSAPAG